MSAPPFSLAERVVFAAAMAVGIREDGGPNRGPPARLWCGGREEPWCAHFLATLFRNEGSPLPGDVEPSPVQHNPIARCFTMHRELERAGCLVEVPAEGDVVFFRVRMSSDPGDGWHCGLVTAVAPDAAIFQTVEGNSGDAVARHSYAVMDRRVIGFARPRE